MRKKRFLAAGFFLAVCLLVFLLILAESSRPDATIVSVPKALWYLLTTITTVGYGDFYPVTTAGRMIGALFQLMTLGLLGVLIGMLASFVRGRALQVIRLSFLQGKTWYIFSENNEESGALAKSLYAEDPERILLFANTEGACFPGKAIALDAQEICRRKKNGDFHLFCLGKNDTENERLAMLFPSLPANVYCRSASFCDALPENRHQFDPAQLCARLYWDRFPLRSPDETVLIIGDGTWAQALLEQGLLQGIIDPAQHVSYIAAGDYSGFCRLHPELQTALLVDTAFGGADSLQFADHWNDDAELIEKADRIIFCLDDEELCRRELGELRRRYPVRGQVYARLSLRSEGAECFGSPAELYTTQLVMGESLNRRAIAVNDLYRRGNPNAPRWHELSDFTRRSNLAAADHLSVKLRLLGESTASKESFARAWERFSASEGAQRERFRRIEHARWMRFHLLNGWRYAPERDNTLRLHPLLLPFDRLSAEDQQKDDYSWEILRFGEDIL